MVGKLISYWNIPLFSMSAMDHSLRDPWDYSTLVRLSTPTDRLATALLVFCHHNDVRVLRTLFCLNCTKAVRNYENNVQIATVSTVDPRELAYDTIRDVILACAQKMT